MEIKLRSRGVKLLFPLQDENFESGRGYSERNQADTVRKGKKQGVLQVFQSRVLVPNVTGKWFHLIMVDVVSVNRTEQRAGRKRRARKESL